MKKIIATLAMLGLFNLGCADDSTSVDNNGSNSTAKPLTAKMVLDLSETAGFFDRGFPSSLMLKANGKVDFSRFPREKHISTQHWRPVAEMTDGYSPMSPIYLRFDGNLAEDPQFFNLPSQPLAYLQDNAPVQLINIDRQSLEYGKRYPLNTGFYAAADKYRPGNLLAVQPLGQLMLENTDYALIVTRDIHQQSQQTPLNPMLDALLKGNSPLLLDETLSPVMAAKALQGFAPLRQWIADQDIDSSQILAAAVWRTGQPTHYIQSLLDQMRDIPLQLAEPWQLLENNDQFCALRSSWQAPVIIKGLSGYLLPAFGGEIEHKQDGTPIIQRYRRSEIVVTLPKREMPAGGFPLMLYSHGTNGRADQVMMRGYTNDQGVTTREGNLAQVAAIRGWASASMAGHMGQEHQQQIEFWQQLLGDVKDFTYNHLTYNPVNPLAMRNNMLQMISERVLFRRLINQQMIDGQLCSESQTSPGTAFFDGNMQVAMGHSLGTFVNSAMAALDDQPLQAVIANGAGTYSLDLSLNLHVKEQYVGDLIEQLFWQLPKNSIRKDPLHPVWALAESALAPANTGLMLNLLHDQKTAQMPHNLVFQGYFDSWVSVTSQKLLHRALRVDLAGDDLAVAETLLPGIIETQQQQLSFPVQGNFSGKTNVVVRYAKDPNYDGHRVLFQYPQAKHQLACFLEDLANNQIPRVIKGSHWLESCQ